VLEVNLATAEQFLHSHFSKVNRKKSLFLQQDSNKFTFTTIRPYAQVDVPSTSLPTSLFLLWHRTYCIGWYWQLAFKQWNL